MYFVLLGPANVTGNALVFTGSASEQHGRCVHIDMSASISLPLIEGVRLRK